MIYSVARPGCSFTELSEYSRCAQRRSPPWGRGEGWDIFPFINLAVPVSSRLNNFRYFMLHGKSADLIAFDHAYRIVLEQKRKEGGEKRWKLATTRLIREEEEEEDRKTRRLSNIIARTWVRDCARLIVSSPNSSFTTATKPPTFPTLYYVPSDYLRASPISYIHIYIYIYICIPACSALKDDSRRW